MNEELRKKAADTMLNLHRENKGHQKWAHAVKLVFRQAELGYDSAPHTFSELQEKVASLIAQNTDLTIVEKALDIAPGQSKLGELSSSDTRFLNAEQEFQANVLGD